MGVGREYGVARQAARDEALDLGLIDASGTPVSGGGGLPNGYDTEVAAEGDFATALAAGGSIYVSGTPADIAASLSLTADTSVFLAPDVTVNFGTGFGSITLGGYTLTVICGGGNTFHYKKTTGTTYILAGGAGRVVTQGELTLTSDGCGLVWAGDGSLDCLIFSSINGAMSLSPYAGTLTVKSLVVSGGGSSAYIDIGASVDSYQVSGTFRTGTAATISSAYSSGVSGHVKYVYLASGTHYLLSTGVVDDGVAAGTLYAGVGTNGRVGRLAGLGYAIVRGDLGDASQKFGPGHLRSIEFNSSARCAEFHGVDFDTSVTIAGPLVDSKFFGGRIFGWTIAPSTAPDFDGNSFHGVFFDSTLTLTRGRYNTFNACVFEPDLTIGAEFDGAIFAAGTRFESNLTINSGANARINGCTIVGTLTNNDPDGSEIIGCVDGNGARIPDQVIGVGRYADSTLDATIKHLVGYFDFTEDVSGNGVYRNKAPGANKQPMPFTGGPAINASGPDGKGITLADIGDFGYVTALDSIGPYRCEFSMAAWIAPDDSTPTTNHSLINLTNLSSTSLGVYIGINATTGYPYLYADGGQRIVGVSNPFTDTVFSLAVMRYKFESGTLTFELFIDNVSIGTSTFAMTAAAGYNWSVALWAFAAALGFIGKISAAQFWNRGLTDAEVSALYNSGSGKFLVGA